MKKVGPNIRSQVNSLKTQALGIRKGGVSRCNAQGCKCCKMLNRSACTVVNNKKVKLARGNCKTYCICYLAVCDICNKPYTGRTVGPLHERINGHRHLYNDILKKVSNNSLHTLDINNDLVYICTRNMDVLTPRILIDISNLQSLKWYHQQISKLKSSSGCIASPELFSASGN